MPKTKLLKKKTSKQTLALFFIGLVLVLTSLSWNIYQSRVLSFNQTEAQIAVVAPPPSRTDANLPKRIIMPRFKIDLPVAESAIKNGVWEINQAGGSHLDASARPGEGGNIVIYGHNKLKLFGKARGLKAGDQISLVTQDGMEHRYEVFLTQVVKPDAIWVLNPTSEEVLTFYTCTGPLDSKRFIVKARVVK